MQTFTLGKLNVAVRYPEGFSEQNTYPVLLYLHGAGNRGTDPELITSDLFFTATESFEGFPFICVAPHCSEDTWFDLWEHLENLVSYLAELPYTDEKRIYLIGASMGGYATWQLAMSLPQYIAAIVPICGGGMYWNAGRLQSIPVWAFHGAKDPVVLLEESVKMVDAVKNNGGEATLTVYPENEHDAWTDTFTNRAVFDWLLTHTK